MPAKNTDSSLWKPIALVLLVAVIAILAYAMGRGSRPVPAPDARPEAAPAAEEARRVPAQMSSGADYTVPAVTPSLRGIEGDARAPVEQPPQPAPPAFEAPPAESTPALLAEEPREDPQSCLSLEAAPNRVEVYGASGPAVQLAVRARNRCGRNFSGPRTYFRVSAIAPGGFELASATGHFDGNIPAWGSAETLVAVVCDPTRVAQYRVELWR